MGVLEGVRKLLHSRRHGISDDSSSPSGSLASRYLYPAKSSFRNFSPCIPLPVLVNLVQDAVVFGHAEVVVEFNSPSTHFAVDRLAHRLGPFPHLVTDRPFVRRQ